MTTTTTTSHNCQNLVHTGALVYITSRAKLSHQSVSVQIRLSEIVLHAAKKNFPAFFLSFCWCKTTKMCQEIEGNKTEMER